MVRGRVRRHAAPQASFSRAVSCSGPTATTPKAQARAWALRFAAGGGVEEGEQPCWMCWRSIRPPRQHIARALAEEFVGANPDNALVQSMAATFRSSGGDIRAVLHTLVQSREFWFRAPHARR